MGCLFVQTGLLVPATSKNVDESKLEKTNRRMTLRIPLWTTNRDLRDELGGVKEITGKMVRVIGF